MMVLVWVSSALPRTGVGFNSREEEMSESHAPSTLLPHAPLR